MVYYYFIVIVKSQLGWVTDDIIFVDGFDILILFVLVVGDWEYVAVEFDTCCKLCFSYF